MDLVEISGCPHESVFAKGVECDATSSVALFCFDELIPLWIGVTKWEDEFYDPVRWSVQPKVKKMGCSLAGSSNVICLHLKPKCVECSMHQGSVAVAWHGAASFGSSHLFDSLGHVAMVLLFYYSFLPEG